MRVFDSGATRDTDEGKLDYEGFLSPYALKAFAEYMNAHRNTPNGLRASDDWQKGMPVDVYMKSAFRHFMDVWTRHRSRQEGTVLSEEFIEALCALMFNVQGLLHEATKPRPHDKFLQSLLDDDHDYRTYKGTRL